MADRAPRRGSLPMSGARLTAALECANDTGVRFTLRRPGDSHGASRLSAGAAASCASADRPASAVRAAPSEAVATPQSEGLVRARTQVCFHTPAPVPWGRSRSISPYAGRRFERRFEAADHPFADRPAVWQPGITKQGRGTPDGSGHSPSRQVRDAPVPGDRWPSRTGLLDRSDFPTEGGWACTSNPPRCRTRHRKRGVAPATAAPSGTASPVLRPWCTRGTPPTPAVRGSRSAPWKPARTPWWYLDADPRTGPLRECRSGHRRQGGRATRGLGRSSRPLRLR